jgi:hypothetical protein
VKGGEGGVCAYDTYDIKTNIFRVHSRTELEAWRNASATRL